MAVKLKRYAQLTDALAGMTCRTLIEVGTWNGRRAQELAATAFRRSDHVTYHGFDLFEALTDDELEAELSKRPPARAQVEAELRRLGRRASLLNMVRPWRRRRFDFALHQGYSRDTLPAFRQANPDLRAEFIFIDGGHSIETITEDWANCSRLVAPGGVIFLDDFYGDTELAEQFGCNQLIERLQGDPAWEVAVLPERDTFEALGTVQIARVQPS
jgi:methyltransferase family protein